MTLLAAVLLLMPLAACGSSGKGEDPSPSPSAGATGLGAVLIVVPDQGFPDSEFWQLHDLLASAGYLPVVASQSGGEVAGSDGTTIKTDVKIADADARDYVGLAIIDLPGQSGLKHDPGLRALAQAMMVDDKVVGAVRMSSAIRDSADPESAHLEERSHMIVVDGEPLGTDSPFLSLDFASDFVDVLSFSRYGGTVVSPGQSTAPSAP